ncbi:MAG: protein kinase [Hyphomicrobiales bacterium]|nr:MAG: protein kinase [Hyphomicrobiales bacterium]
MTDPDPQETQRDTRSDVRADLEAAGFEDPEEIGRGGFGVVFRCRQRSLDRVVAVKVLTTAVSPEDIDRFVREQRAMGRLSGHPNVVTVFQAEVTTRGSPYLVMQYLPFGSLDTLIRRDGPLGWRSTLHVGIKIAGALETGHRLGILHRDVKPANILLTEYGHPQLTDFGIAHISGGFETAAGVVTGSPAFTAPEILKGDHPSPSADIYGLGATLFCALTGHAAFERRSGEQMIAQFLRITTQPIPNLREQGLPDDVCAAIERAMASDPADRPATVAEFGEYLREIERRHNYGVDDMEVAPTGVDDRAYDEHAPQPSVTPAGAQKSMPPGLFSTDPKIASAIPRHARGRSGNLPLELTSFVGRRRELTETKRRMTLSRLVTLTGVGGVGKTRLALRVAADSVRTFDDGVWLVELGELRDGGFLAEAIASTVGLLDGLARPPLTQLTDYFAERKLLVVLDNCEHLVDPVAKIAETLLRACPKLQILATSREPLGIAGEAAMRVPPLATPDTDRTPSMRGIPGYDAVTLFAERAEAAVPDFEVTDANRVAVTRICQRLDGLPLPIELAAARMRAMSAQQILDRLNDRYRLLTGGHRGAPTRQQTLRLCIDWSYELCTSREQQIWSCLSVFAGGFDLDAAEGVCGDHIGPDDLLDLVTSLVDKSILIREEAGTEVRYRLLETLREYGTEKLQTSGDYESLRRRHRDWYEQLVLRAEREWIGPHQVEWLNRLDREEPNLREALQLCVSEGQAANGLRIAVALYPLWFARGLLSEGRRWLDGVLSIGSGPSTPAQLRALHAACVLAGRQTDIPAATALLAEVRAVADDLDDRMAHALASQAQGTLALYQSDFSGAVANLTEALEVFRTEDDLLLRIVTLQLLGLANGLGGNAEQAVACNEEALTITRMHGESVYRGRSACLLGIALWQQDNTKRATEMFDEGLRLTQLVDDPLGSAWCLEGLAWIAARQNPHKSATLLGSAEALWQGVGSPSVHIPGLGAFHDVCERRTRSALGERPFVAAYAKGRSMRVEDVVALALDEQRPSEPAGEAVGLTRREKEVAQLVADGLTNRAIAEQLVISHRTAQGHVEHILTKLGFHNRAQIAAWVVEHLANEA